ncbi:hypothetical protein [Sabulicella glaciei]|uniref:Glycine zipper 2TM domain-containing protein n=1 Tax=Sabulicella glaciei TaxID=2984948 RepID=A0ABT3NUK8_9PROT|nr:hypothetical protein [Roseococcus sp. MDT2-1-1]MCW8085845.1 hypothetical protein [Roseococcus sp. MDT2-1-1]
MKAAPTLLLALALAGCGTRYNPDEYASRAVQQANPVQQGVVIGARRIAITTDGHAGAAVGGASGGALGAASGGHPMASTLGAVSGALVGGVLGAMTERAATASDGTEYIIRRTDRPELVSVTQRDRDPLPVGARVLVIAGAQARIVPDYTSEIPGLPPLDGAPPTPSPQPVAARPLALSAIPLPQPHVPHLVGLPR